LLLFISIFGYLDVNWFFFLQILLNQIAALVLSSFTFMWPCIVTNFFIIKPTRCTNFTNLFCHEILHVSDSLSVHHQEFFTVLSALVYVIQVCRQLSNRKSVYKLVWHIPLLIIKWINSWWWTDRLDLIDARPCATDDGLIYLCQSRQN